MKISKNLSPAFWFTLMLPLLFMAVRFSPLSLFDASMVGQIENYQALWLLFCGVFTLAAMLPLSLSKPTRLFWIWSAYWWFVLLGRSISWGREYFPDVPHLYFRIISVLWIAPLIVALFSKALRAEIARKIRDIPFPVAIFSLALISFLISDTVEHKRVLAFLFVDSPEHQDIIEELYEIPFMVALFMTACYYMRMDKLALAHPVRNRPDNREASITRS